jgi:thymidylate synthase (FAD)
MATIVDVLNRGFIRLISHMGDDLQVVNAARVSFSKQSDWQRDKLHPAEPIIGLRESDAKLIRYLVEHKHWTPFGHCCITLHYKMPVFVARQYMRSNVGIVYNEVSRRYVDTPPEFYNPEWRARPDGGIKQGSGDTIEYKPIRFILKDGNLGSAEQAALDEYNNRLERGVAPEVARTCLPVSHYTEFWATMSLAAAARVYNLRIDSHAQKEIQAYATAMDTIIRPLFPVSWLHLARTQT